jgi:hypothetical protein
MRQLRMGAEKRTLRRIDNKYGFEFKACLEIRGQTLAADVIDYNSLGASLKFSGDAHLIYEAKVLDKLQISYGSETVCNLKNVRVKRFDAFNKKLIVVFTDAPRDFEVVRTERVNLGFSVQGSLYGTDPFTIDQVLMFKVTNISLEGFGIVSSKSNRHITPGLTLQKFTLNIPTYGNFTISFSIVNVDDGDGHIRFGCKFEKASKQLRKTIKKLLLISAPLILPPDEIDPKLKKRIKEIKNFDRSIRIRRFSTQAEFEQILKIRFRAYKLVNKIVGDKTWQDMKDSYDEHAIVYAASVGATIAGTIRLVFRSEDNKLPFEEYINPSDIKKFNVLEATEISKFAIDPHFQGTDIFLAIFRKLLFENGAKQIKYPVCMSTEKLLPYYKSIGAVTLHDPVPHPTLANETLTLLMFDPERIVRAKMSAVGWFFIARPTLKLIRKFNFAKVHSRGISKYFTFIYDFFLFIVARAKRKK